MATENGKQIEQLDARIAELEAELAEWKDTAEQWKLNAEIAEEQLAAAEAREQEYERLHALARQIDNTPIEDIEDSDLLIDLNIWLMDAKELGLCERHHAALDAYVEKQTAELKKHLAAVCDEFKEAQADFDVALEARTIEILNAVENTMDGFVGDVPDLETGIGKAFLSVMEKQDAALEQAERAGVESASKILLAKQECGHPLAVREDPKNISRCFWCESLEQARGFRDAWKAAAKKYYVLYYQAVESIQQIELMKKSVLEKAREEAVDKARPHIIWETYNNVFDAIFPDDWRDHTSEPMTIDDVRREVTKRLEYELEKARAEGAAEGAAEGRERCAQIAEGHAEEYGKEYERLHVRSQWSKAHVAAECQTTALYIAKALREADK